MNKSKHDSDVLHYKARLFIAGDSPNSLKAKENLKKIQQQLKGFELDVEIIDVMEDPQVALTNSIFLTPALQILSPNPESIIFGNLSDKKAWQSLFPEPL